MKELYADIVLPIARNVFTFRVGDAIVGALAEGMMVRVPLGPSKLYPGIVWRLHGEHPPYKTIRDVDTVIDVMPPLGERQRRLWQWIADYYMCTLGDVMRAAVPPALKPSALTEEDFSRKSYKVPVRKHISLDPAIATHESLNVHLESLSRRAPAQYRAMMAFVEAAGDGVLHAEVPQVALSAAPAALSELCRKSILRCTAREVPLDEPSMALPAVLPVLSPAQQLAAAQLTAALHGGGTALLHGVTGSGKTEVYVHLIDEQLRRGRDVIYLVPEIAMTAQHVGRMRGWFGDRVIVYHSRIPARGRAEAWRRAGGGSGGRVILGTRSALLLPVADLGLVVVDEEHDASYKQDDPAPRYNARDCALVLARMHGAGVVLGSATPSVGTWFNAVRGKYALVGLAERYGNVQMPQVIVSDTLRAIKRGERRAYFNKVLLDHIDAALGAGHQVMLLQNRRGFAPYLACGECGEPVMCRRCNVALTYHKTENRLRCHYCGYTQSPPAVCGKCGKGEILMMGTGTEKVEESLRELFPRARVVRFDRDSATSGARIMQTVSAFDRGEYDIMVGTQMITKGFDFGRVSLVGILSADQLSTFPDFRASERAFQTMTQMAGRAGRRGERGTVVVQTTRPGDPVVQFMAAGDYEGMMAAELEQRREFMYPPFCRLIALSLSHRDGLLLREAADFFAAAATGVFGPRMLGPEAPPVDKIRGLNYLSFLFKSERGQPFAAMKDQLHAMIARLHGEKKYRYVEVACNVDPI